MAKTKQPPKYFVLLWEMLPDALDVFLIPRAEISKDDVRMLARCHGNYIHGDRLNDHHGKHTQEEVNFSLARLNEMVATPGQEWHNKEYKKRQAKQLGMSVSEFNAILGSWIKYRIDSTNPRVLPRARFFQSGYLM